MTVYLFDQWKQVRKIIPPTGVTELIHDEDNHQLHAVVDMQLRVHNGEHLGFMCADKRFRLFTVVMSEDFDDRGVTIITGMDASVQELREMIVEDCTQTTTVKQTVEGLLRSAGALDLWAITGEDSTETKETKAYFTSVWNIMAQCEGLYLWQIVPYYTFQGGQISGRVIELAKDEAVFRGRILKSKKDATNVYVIRTDPPITRLYVTGASAGTGDMQTSVTISGVSWSKAAGNPVDKPAGQNYIEDPEAVEKHGLHSASISLTHIQTADELIRAAWEELQKRKEPTCTVEATVQDMEQVHGYQHQIIRLGDRVPIRLSNATMEAARVINIKRDYIRPWLTKVVLGERVQTIQTQLRQMQSFSSDFSVSQDHVKKETEKNSSSIRDMGSQLLMNAALIQLNAEMIQANAHVIELNAEQIRMNAEQIELKAGKQEVTELGETVSAAMVMIDGINAQLALKATKAEVTEVSSRLSLAEIALDGANAALLLKAERTDVDALGERITSAEIKVDGANSKVDVLAEEIRLAGYVKADELETEILYVFSANIESAIAGYLSANELDVSSLVSSSVNTNYLSADSIGADSISTGELTIGGTSFTSSSLTMGSVASGTIVGPSDINLSHSHAVSVSGGTVTLGEVSSSGGSFNIADTQYYKDGVAAARTSGYNNGYSDARPTSISSDVSYSSGSNTYSIYATVHKGDGTTWSYPLDDITATSAYNNGWNACRSAASSAEVYTISQYAPGTLYVKVGDYYSSAGSSWVQVTRKYGVYYLPGEK